MGTATVNGFDLIGVCCNDINILDVVSVTPDLICFLADTHVISLSILCRFSHVSWHIR